MARVQGGDEAALGELMERWELPVKRLLARLVQNAAEADDLAQETFVRVWQQREKFRAGAEFRPWMFAIAVNLGNALYRSFQYAEADEVFRDALAAEPRPE